MVIAAVGIIIVGRSASNVVAQRRRIRDDFHASFHPIRFDSRGTIENRWGKGLRSHEMRRLLLCSGREDNEGSREEKAKGWPRRRQREREEREKSQRYTQATFHARFRVAANERDCVSPASSARFMLMSKQMAGLE